MTRFLKWVEEEAQLVFLAKCGCDLAQGYLLGRPQPAEVIDRVLARDAAGRASRHGGRPGLPDGQRARAS